MCWNWAHEPQIKILNILNELPQGLASSSTQVVAVKSVHAPGSYTGPPSFANDIAIIELDKHLKMHDNVRPACQPQAEPISGSTAYLSGWGKIGEGN